MKQMFTKRVRNVLIAAVVLTVVGLECFLLFSAAMSLQNLSAKG